MAVDGGGRLFVGYKDTDDPGGAWRVAFASSSDGGASWTLHGPLAFLRGDPDRISSDPWLLADGDGTLYYARPESTTDPATGQFLDSEIVVSRSDDGGATWELTTTAHVLGTGFADRPNLATDDDGSLYVVYVLFEEGCCTSVSFLTMSIVVSRSGDRGETWTASRVFEGAHLAAPVVAAEPDGAVYVVWEARDFRNVMASRSLDGGVTWSGAVRVNASPGTVVEFDRRDASPSLAIDDTGTLLAGWIHEGTDVLVARSEDGGATWEAPVRVNDASAGSRWQVALRAAAGRVHAAWYDTRTGNVNVAYSVSTDGGRTWSDAARATSEETPAQRDGRNTRLGDYLGLAADAAGTAYLAWTDWRGSFQDIYFAGAEPF